MEPYMTQAEQGAADFLRIAADFKLGRLPTEQQHPLTGELSSLAGSNLAEAYELVRGIDLSVLETLKDCIGEVSDMAKAMEETLRSGHKIFLSGCGATGRLALTLEWIWRQESHRLNTDPEQVVAFMAGGDLAVVKAIEDFEDHPEYGRKQLRELGFGSEDLLIAITEGGETSFVIGTVEEASETSVRKPYFMYCNPDDVLCSLVERSRKVLENPEIISLCLETGPQVLSGSTRMQASTIQQLAAGTALIAAGTNLSHQRGSSGTDWTDSESLLEQISRLGFFFENLDLAPLADLTVHEAEIYAKGEYLIYETPDYPMAVATDTTERAPTFSLHPFENFDDGDAIPAWTYISIPGTASALDAWTSLLGHPPRTLEWDDVRSIAGIARLEGYDISERARKRREELLSGKALHSFRIYRNGEDMVWEFRDRTWKINTGSLDLLAEFTLLKILLNTHSTLVMGRLGRYESNIMLYVRPSNFKLIDRSARYILHLLERAGVTVSYEEVVTELFRQLENMREDQSVVRIVSEALIKNHDN